MQTSKNTILITGGSTGIGYALAERFVNSGNQVIICGRRKEQLEQAQLRVPSLKTIQCDVSQATAREALVKQVVREFPKLNVLINNAGIQNRLPPFQEGHDWERHQMELNINLAAPMHLSMLLIPHLLKDPAPAIMNVSSGLAFAPLAFMPTYCATKAALHSFTLSLRHQLAQTPIKVVEIIPPAVNTDLGGKGLHNDGAPLDLFADHAMARIAAGDLEFGFGFSEKSRMATREQLDQLFKNMNH